MKEIPLVLKILAFCTKLFLMPDANRNEYHRANT